MKITLSFEGRQQGLPADGKFPALPDLDVWSIRQQGSPAEGATFAVPANSDEAFVQAEAARVTKRFLEAMRVA